MLEADLADVVDVHAHVDARADRLLDEVRHRRSSPRRLELSTLGVAVIGTIFGLLAGYASGTTDAVVSRIAEIFSALPLILGAIIILISLPPSDEYFVIIFKVVLVFWVLTWPTVFRLMRSSVMQIKPNDYVQAARALGASPWRVVTSHILPNAVAPVIVVSTINLGVFISAEAALSFLGIGLQPPTISWGVMISDALIAMRSAPHVLLFPAGVPEPRRARLHHARRRRPRRLRPQDTLGGAAP